MNNKDILIKAATDEEIISLCAGEVTNRKDLDLKDSNNVAIKGGLYDPVVFGALYRCSCIRKHSKIGTRCPKCGALIVDAATGDSRYGYYTLVQPIIYHHKLQALQKALRMELPRLLSYYGRKRSEEGLQKIWSIKIVPEPVTDTEDKLFDYVKDSSGLIYRLRYGEYSKDDSPENFKYYGPRGLYNLIKNYTKLDGSKFTHLEGKINQVVPISPASQRKYSKIGSKVQFPQISIMYGMIIETDEIIRSKFDHDDTLSLADMLTLMYAINRMVNLAMKTYQLVRTSKQSLIRYAMGGRVPKSARATIVGDPTVDIDTIYVPEALAYEALKEDLLNAYEEKYPKRLSIEDYLNYTDDMKSLFYEMVENCVVIINRQPTLFRFGTLAQKPKLYDGSALKMNLLTCTPMNADFDGDQVAMYFLTKDPLKTIVWERMAPSRNWYYERSFDPIYVPNTQILLGLHYASKKFMPKLMGEFDSFEEAEAAYKDKTLNCDEICTIEGEETTYGREKISRIMGMPYDRIFADESDKNHIISSKNIGDIVALIGAKPNRAEILQSLQEFSLQVVTSIGNTTATLKDFYQFDPHIPEIEEVIKDPRRSDKEKYRKLGQMLPGIIKKRIYELPTSTIRNALEGSGKAKLPQLVEVFAPKIEYKQGKLKVVEENLATGLSESAIIHHAEENRGILNYKKSLTPSSGYMTREFVNVGYNLIYKENLKSDDTIGIEVPEVLARGRYTIDGRFIPSNSNSLDWVRVKSPIFRKSNDVASDEVAQYKYNLSPNKPIGISLETALTEFLTQSQLQLKHGGSLMRPLPEFLSFRDVVTVEEIQNDFIIIRVGGIQKKYPLPNNNIITLEAKEGSVPAGEPVYWLDEMMALDYKLAQFVFLVGSCNREHMETKISPIECYAYTSGRIHYELSSRTTGKVKGTVHIGNIKLPWYSDQLYYFAEGDEVKFGDKLCSGVQNISALVKRVPDIGKAFWIFYDCILKLTQKPINLEPLEFLFKGILKTRGYAVEDTLKKNDDYIAKTNFSSGYSALCENVDEHLADSFITSIMVNFKGYKQKNEVQ